MKNFDWRAMASKPGAMLIDKEDVPVVGSLELGFFDGVTGSPVRESSVMMNGGRVSEEEFERLVANRLLLKRVGPTLFSPE